MDTFVVQVWPGDASAPETPLARRAGLGDPALRGVVRHVRSGRETVFATPDELFEFLATSAVECTPAADVAGDRRIRAARR
ncbi:MAG TPA: hypothetical protein VFO50_05245 [Candidatus Limnocylindrales bacterium]|nr:hypothetical protein [Candidatus Limnocylindrales bacterium]